MPAFAAQLALAGMLGVALGCAADSGTAGGGSQAVRGGNGPDPVVVENGKCTDLGEQACVCSDGTARGTQTCLQDGTLSPCVCAPASSGGAGTGGAGTGGGGETPLCAELAGNSSCTAETFQSAELPASILFVVDRSGSMNCNLPPLQTSEECEMVAQPKDASQPSKWQVTVGALKDAFTQLGAAKANAQLGLTFFSNDDVCGVSSKPVIGVSPLTDSNLTSLTTILDATKPAGGTPIIGSTILAYQYLHQEAGSGIECPGPQCPCAAPPCGAIGNRYVVLITDGQESCAANADELLQWQTQLLDTEAPKAVRANVRTFVVGSPGSEPSRGFLSELAFQGGTARNDGSCSHDRTSADGDCHFDMTKTTDFAGDLAAVLSDISGAALSCQFSVPTVLDSDGEGKVNVQLTAGAGGAPECIARDDSKPCEGGANGFQFAKLPSGENDLTKVVLCGAACDRVKNDPGIRVDVLVGCQSIGPD